VSGWLWQTFTSVRHNQPLTLSIRRRSPRERSARANVSCTASRPPIEIPQDPHRDTEEPLVAIPVRVLDCSDEIGIGRDGHYELTIHEQPRTFTQVPAREVGTNG